MIRLKQNADSKLKYGTLRSRGKSISIKKGTTEKFPRNPYPFDHQCLLRVPENISIKIEASMKRTPTKPIIEIIPSQSKNSIIGRDFRVFMFGDEYAAAFMDLPNRLESYVSFDAQSVFKSADVSQVLVVYPKVEGIDSISNSVLENYATQSSPYILQEGVTFTRPDQQSSMKELVTPLSENLNVKSVDGVDVEFPEKSIDAHRMANQRPLDDRSPPSDPENAQYEAFFNQLYSDGKSEIDKSMKLSNTETPCQIGQQSSLPRDVAISRLLAEQKLLDLLKGEEIVWCEEISIPTDNLQVIVRGVQSTRNQVNYEDHNLSSSVRSANSDVVTEPHADEVFNSYLATDGGMQDQSEIWKPTSDIIMILNALGLLKDGVDISKRRTS